MPSPITRPFRRRRLRRPRPRRSWLNSGYPPGRRRGYRRSSRTGRALEDARHSYSLSPLHDVVRAWQARLEAVPAVREFLTGGRDDSDGVDLTDALDGGR
ncbi:DUF6247 family protein [Streptomyces sp. NPDC001139]